MPPAANQGKAGGKATKAKAKAGASTPTPPEQAATTPQVKRSASIASLASKSSSSATKQPRRSLKMTFPVDEKMPGGNALFLQSILDSCDIIMDHPMFENVMDAPPRKIEADAGANSGIQAVYDENQFSVAISEVGHYKAGCNLFWIDFMFLANPRVPIRASAVRTLKQHYFSKPCLFPTELVVAVSSLDVPSTKFGSLKCISPEELRIALIERIAERIKAGADDAELEGWLSTVLTVTFHFKAIENDEERGIEAIQLREHLTVDFKSMARTARQWVYVIISIKQDMEKKGGKCPTDEEIAEYIQDHVRLAKGREPISGSYVNAAITVSAWPKQRCRFLRGPHVPSRPVDSVNSVGPRKGDGEFDVVAQALAALLWPSPVRCTTAYSPTSSTRRWWRPRKRSGGWTTR